MNALKFIVPGEPKGKGRPRFTRAGHTYTPGATRAYEVQVQEAARKAMHGLPPVSKEVAFEVNVEAFFPIPKSWSKKKRLSALQGDQEARHRQRGQKRRGRHERHRLRRRRAGREAHGDEALQRDASS